MKVGCKKAKGMYLRGDVSAKEIVSRFERMTTYVLFITLISPKQGQNHHMLKFLADMRQGEQKSTKK